MPLFVAFLKGFLLGDSATPNEEGQQTEEECPPLFIRPPRFLMILFLSLTLLTITVIHPSFFHTSASYPSSLPVAPEPHRGIDRRTSPVSL